LASVRSFWRVMTWSPTPGLWGGDVQTLGGDLPGRDAISSSPAVQFGHGGTVGGEHDAG
jgi:hypothetical protein